MNRRAKTDPLLPLLQQVIEGDRRAFSTLYEATNHRITVYLYRLIGNRDCVEDILVETYTQVWKSSSTFRRQSAVLTWMIGIARNIAFKEIGRIKIHDDIADHSELTVQPVNLDKGNRDEVLNRAISALSPKHREILDLVFFQELPYRDISGMLGIPESTVKSRVFYAKASLKQQLASMGIGQDDI